MKYLRISEFVLDFLDFEEKIIFEQISIFLSGFREDKSFRVSPRLSIYSIHVWSRKAYFKREIFEILGFWPRFFTFQK